MVALLQGGLEEEGGLQLVRGGGWLSLIRQGCSPELGLQVGLWGGRGGVGDSSRQGRVGASLWAGRGEVGWGGVRRIMRPLLGLL